MPSSTVTIDEYSWGGVEAGAGFVMADFYDGKLHDWRACLPVTKPGRRSTSCNGSSWIEDMSVQQTAAPDAAEGALAQFFLRRQQMLNASGFI
jgi:hypothetical protein